MRSLTKWLARLMGAAMLAGLVSAMAEVIARQRVVRRADAEDDEVGDEEV
ncbi:MAG: hypothetical protein ACXWMU_05035 [Candidatus Limnocylindrales bacterium]